MAISNSWRMRTIFETVMSKSPICNHVAFLHTIEWLIRRRVVAGSTMRGWMLMRSRKNHNQGIWVKTLLIHIEQVWALDGSDPVMRGFDRIWVEFDHLIYREVMVAVSLVDLEIQFGSEEGCEGREFRSRDGGWLNLAEEDWDVEMESACHGRGSGRGDRGCWGHRGRLKTRRREVAEVRKMQSEEAEIEVTGSRGRVYRPNAEARR